MKEKNYFITEHSYALTSNYNEYGERQCIVQCREGEFHINQSDLQVLNQSLALNGLTMKAARECSKVILKKRSMLPLDLNPHLRWIWFSLFSVRADYNYWFSLDGIFDFDAASMNETIVELVNGKQIKVPIAKSAFNQKYMNAIKYKQLKEVRQKRMKTESQFYIVNQVAEDRVPYIV